MPDFTLWGMRSLVTHRSYGHSTLSHTFLDNISFSFRDRVSKSLTLCYEMLFLSYPSWPVTLEVSSWNLFLLLSPSCFLIWGGTLIWWAINDASEWRASPSILKSKVLLHWLPPPQMRFPLTGGSHSCHQYIAILPTKWWGGRGASSEIKYSLKRLAWAGYSAKGLNVIRIKCFATGFPASFGHSSECQIG